MSGSPLFRLRHIRSNTYVPEEEYGTELDKVVKQLKEKDPHTLPKTLDLSNQQIGDEGTKQLAEALKTSEHVLSLNLGDGDVKAYEKRQNPEKQYGNNIGAEGAKELARVLKENKHLTELDLKDNRIGDSGTKELVGALKVNTRLAKLHLSSNDIGLEGAQEIAAALRVNKHLTELDLCQNEIDADGVEALAKALEANTGLVTLKLSNNMQIKEAGATHLGNLLKTPRSQLTTLELSGCKIGLVLAQCLGDALKVNKQLTSLILMTNNIGDEGLKRLAAGLKVNMCLTKLWLAGNNIGDEGVQELSKVLKYDNYILSELSLPGNEIGDRGVGYLADALKRNRGLTDISLRKNKKVGVEGWKSLGRALAMNDCLLSLQLGGSDKLGTHMSEGDMRDFAASLQMNHTLQKLNLFSENIGNKLFHVLIRKGLQGHPSLVQCDVDGNPCSCADKATMAKKGWAASDCKDDFLYDYFLEVLRGNSQRAQTAWMVNARSRYRVDTYAALLNFLVYAIDILSSVVFYSQEIQGPEFKRHRWHPYVQPVALGLIVFNLLLLLYTKLCVNVTKLAGRDHAIGGARQLNPMILESRQAEVKQFEMAMAEMEMAHAQLWVIFEDCSDIALLLVIAASSNGGLGAKFKSPAFVVNFVITITGTVLFVLSHLRAGSLKRQRQKAVSSAEANVKERAKNANLYGGKQSAAEDTDSVSKELKRTIKYMMSHECMYTVLKLELSRSPSYVQAFITFEDDTAMFLGEEHRLRVPWDQDKGTLKLAPSIRGKALRRKSSASVATLCGWCRKHVSRRTEVFWFVFFFSGLWIVVTPIEVLLDHLCAPPLSVEDRSRRRSSIAQKKAASKSRKGVKKKKANPLHSGDHDRSNPVGAAYAASAVASTAVSAHMAVSHGVV